MTCNERIEKTLNRAGQTITDLPKDYSDIYCYGRIRDFRRRYIVASR